MIQGDNGRAEGMDNSGLFDLLKRCLTLSNRIINSRNIGFYEDNLSSLSRSLNSTPFQYYSYNGFLVLLLILCNMKSLLLCVELAIGEGIVIMLRRLGRLLPDLPEFAINELQMPGQVRVAQFREVAILKPYPA